MKATWVERSDILHCKGLSILLPVLTLDTGMEFKEIICVTHKVFESFKYTGRPGRGGVDKTCWGLCWAHALSSDRSVGASVGRTH